MDDEQESKEFVLSACLDDNDDERGGGYRFLKLLMKQVKYL